MLKESKKLIFVRKTELSVLMNTILIFKKMHLFTERELKSELFEVE